MLILSIIVTISLLLLTVYMGRFSEHNRRSRSAKQGWIKRRARVNKTTDARKIKVYRGRQLVDVLEVA
jgi:hypothetical protein